MVADASADEPRPAALAPLAPAAGGGAPGDGQIPANGTATERLVFARNALRAMQVRFTAEHPDVIQLKRLVADLETKAAAEAAEHAAAHADAVDVVAPGDAARRDRITVARAELENL